MTIRKKVKCLLEKHEFVRAFLTPRSYYIELLHFYQDEVNTLLAYREEVTIFDVPVKVLKGEINSYHDACRYCRTKEMDKNEKKGYIYLLPDCPHKNSQEKPTKNCPYYLEYILENDNKKDKSIR